MKLISSVAASIICIIVLSCFAQNDKPVNTLTEQSKRTNLTCCSERGSIAWKHQQLNNDGVSDQICLDQSCNRPGHSVDNSTPGCFHLIINATSNDAAGLYQCNEVETSSVRGAYLVVYNFSCGGGVDFGNSDDLVEGDKVKFNCSVSWKGKWPFKIRLLNEVGKEIQKDVINDVNSYYNSSFEVNVSKPIFPSHTIQFAFLNDEITDPNVDKSCPTINWTSPARNVKYGPNIIKLSCPLEGCVRRIGDTINCSADGYPSPELHWLKWNDEKIASGSVLELKCLDPHEYKCIATNIIRGKSYETSKGITVDVKPKPDVDGSRCAEAISRNNVLIAETISKNNVLIAETISKNNVLIAETISKNNVLLAETISKNNVLMISLTVVIVVVVVVVVVVAIIGVIAFCFRGKICELCARNQTPSAPEQIELQPQQQARLLGNEKAPEGDKNPLPPGEQNAHNDRIIINHKEYNDAKSITELGACDIISLHAASEDDRSSIYPDSRYAQPVDSEISGDEGFGVHLENSEGASLLGATLEGAEDKMRKSNSTLPSSAGFEVVLHRY